MVAGRPEAGELVIKRVLAALATGEDQQVPVGRGVTQLVHQLAREALVHQQRDLTGRAVSQVFLQFPHRVALVRGRLQSRAADKTQAR